MDIGIVGLGRMGLNMALRLRRGGHRVVVHNRSPEPVNVAVGEGAEAADSFAALAAALDAPRVVWLMLPAGDVTQQHVDEALEVLDEGDVLVDGANGPWRDALRHGAQAREHGVSFVDVGVSGGVWGLEEGYSLMAGGSEAAVEQIAPALRTLAPTPETGWGRVGPVGAGHFVKMVHNGIEYGMMQSLGEGFAVLAAKREWGQDAGGEPVEHDLDLGRVARIWQDGTVIRSWLLDLAAEVLEERPRLEGIAPFVPDSGHGRGTVEAGIDLRVPTPVIAASLFARFGSRDEAHLSDRLASALRGQFGGHPVKGQPGEGADLHDDGTVDVVPGGVHTEGADTRPETDAG